MISKEKFKETRAEDRKLVKRIVQDSLIMNDEELLSWAMNQLFRAARAIDILNASKGILETDPISLGCDATAETILIKLKSRNSGLKLIKETNPKLLENDDENQETE